jgi:4-amino-4-deoxy-L-arabinose transferase-like glycosyltransferase
LQLSQYYNKIGISHVILISIILHVLVISQPPNQIGDESIFLTIFRVLQTGVDHTPYKMPGLSFLLFPSVEIFGDYWFSWRATSVLFGALFLLVLYHTVKKITTEKNALFVTILVSLDITIFVHSSLFLRDIPVMFFGTFATYMYFTKRYHLTALLLGFTALIKESALFFLILIITYHLITTRPWKKHNVKQAVFFVLILSGSFLIPLWIYDVVVNPNIYDERYNYYTTSDQPKLIGHVTNPFEHLNVYLFGGYLISDTSPVGNNHFLINTILPISESEPVLKIDTESHTRRIYKEMYKVTEIIETGWIISYSNYPLWIISFWVTVPYIVFNIAKNQHLK